MISYRGSRFECAKKKPLKRKKVRCTRTMYSTYVEKTHGLLETTWHYLAPAHMQYPPPSTQKQKADKLVLYYSKLHTPYKKTIPQEGNSITAMYSQSSTNYVVYVRSSSVCTEQSTICTILASSHLLHLLFILNVPFSYHIGFFFPSQHCSPVLISKNIHLKSTLCVRSTQYSVLRTQILAPTFLSPLALGHLQSTFCSCLFPRLNGCVYLDYLLLFAPRIWILFAAELEITLNSTFRHLFFFPIRHNILIS